MGNGRTYGGWHPCSTLLCKKVLWGGGDKWPEFLLPISIITVGCSVQPSMQ